MTETDAPCGPEALERMRARRGYLLPHHGLLCLLTPGIAEAYDDLYDRLTLQPRVLDDHAREFIWLVILASVQSGTAPHHVQRFCQAGGTLEEVATALQIAALPAASASTGFAEARWSGALPGFDRTAAYRRSLPAPVGRLTTGMIELGALVAHACKREAWGTRLHLRASLAAGLDEAALGEALSLIIFPSGLPCFVQAAWIWRDCVADGSAPASAAFQAWAAATAAESGASGAALPPA